MMCKLKSNYLRFRYNMIDFITVLNSDMGKRCGRVFLIAMLLFVGVCNAQEERPLPKADRPIHVLTDTSALMDTTQTWEFHLSMGSSVVGGTFGSASMFGVTPSVIYRPNDRLKVRASLTAIDSWSLSHGNYSVRGYRPNSVTPYRNPGSVAAAMSLAASYKVNDRLWIAASLIHINGGIESAALVNPWFMGDFPVMLNATAFSAAMRYRLGNDSFLDIHMTIIDDRTGALGPLLFGGPYGSSYYYHNTTFGGHLF